MKYTVKGLNIMCGDRVVCSAIASVARYHEQKAELEAICLAINGFEDLISTIESNIKDQKDD